MSFALNALNLDDLMPQALDVLHFSRQHNAQVTVELPQSQAKALPLQALLLAVDAQQRRQLFVVTSIESLSTTEARLGLRAVYGVAVLEVQSLFWISAERLAPLLLNASEASTLDAQFPALRFFMRDVYGHLRLEADHEEHGLELLLSLFLNARQEGMHPFLFDAYGVLKRSQLPGLHLVELGRTHAFPVEAWGVERLIEEWTKGLPTLQCEEVWRQWNAIAGQRIFRVQSLRELEEVFLSTQSGLLFRLLNQFKSSNIFCDSGHQENVHLLQELKQAETEGKLLVLDLSSVSVDYHAWVWQLLNQALRHSMMPLSRIIVGNVSRHATLPVSLQQEVHQLLEQGVNVVNLHPLIENLTVPHLADARKTGIQHLLQLNESQSTALFLSELSLGIPLLFGDFPALPTSFVQASSSLAINVQDVSELTLAPAVWTDVDALKPLEGLEFLEPSIEMLESDDQQPSTPFQAIEPPSLQTLSHESPEFSVDSSYDALLMSFSPHGEEASEAPDVLTDFQEALLVEEPHEIPTEDALHRYRSVLSEMPEEWRNLIETQLLNPTKPQASPAPVETSEEVESTHHIHPCLPDSMLEDVAPYLDETADSGFDDPEKATLHVEYIIDGKEELKRKPLSTVDVLEQTLSQTEPIFGQYFDPYYVPAPGENFHAPVPNPLPSSLVGPILPDALLETLPELSLDLPMPSSVEPISSSLLSYAELPEPRLDFHVEESPLAFAESPEFESEGFYDDLLSEPIIEAHAPQAEEDSLSDAFLPHTPAAFNPQEQLEGMTVVLDAVHAGDVSLPVHQAIEVDTLSLEDFDHFNFDLNVINKAVHAEFNDMANENPVSPADFSDLEVELAETPAPVVDPEDPLAGFSFEMPQEATPALAEEASVLAEESVSSGMPEFLVPAFDESSFAEDELIQSFQQDLAEMDSGYVPLKGSQYNQTAPMRTIADASQTQIITPPHSLDGVPITHTPLYEYQDASPATPVELPTQVPVHYSPGMHVQHEVYGVGVVHSVVDIENRTVLSIVFEKAGKRLIDPTLTAVVPV